MRVRAVLILMMGIVVGLAIDATIDLIILDAVLPIVTAFVLGVAVTVMLFSIFIIRAMDPRN